MLNSLLDALNLHELPFAGFGVGRFDVGSAKTVRDLAVLIKTLLRFAQREYHCVCDALNAKLPACTQKKIDVFSETELAVLGKALFPSKKISLAVMLALHAGINTFCKLFS